MTATCPVDPKHRAFRQSGGDGIACIDCQTLSKAKIARGNKYNAVKVETPLGTADSRKEGKRLCELALMEAAAEPPDLRLNWVTEVKGLEYLEAVRLHNR